MIFFIIFLSNFWFCLLFNFLNLRLFNKLIGLVLIEIMLWMILLMFVVVFWYGLIVDGWLWDFILNIMVWLLFILIIFVFLFGFISICLFDVGNCFKNGLECL